MKNKSQFLRGCARTLVLQLLSERPMYGYELAVALARRSEGIFELGQGTLYPLLYSLQADGVIRASREEQSADGRRRQYYALTPAGRRRLEADLVTWRDIVRGVGLVLGSGNAG
jgi:PadR family transcriptional regulator PadR